MTYTDKVRENRARRAAQRQGYQLIKSSRRDPRAIDFGKWWLVDPSTTALVFTDEWGASLEEIEEWLYRPFDVDHSRR
ncbi:hypothetical protein SAMN06265360_1073 [Haloechinothrix alba]|uniref:Uncharacterized protein n=1 Tax=Haloechinothrix alba TaxID=664784 RepID=A0A238WNM4_9PSEU|nr:hypothetical protein [Haloechinothrix alba]SNR47854.1 hypothetical protein SAMN06265360_1073 [Haloechinothrix alba]